MSEKLNEATWRAILEQAALRATDSKAEQYRKITRGKEFDQSSLNKTYNGYLERLKKAYPFESVKQSDLDAIDMFNADSMRTYLDQFNAPNRVAPSPTEFVKAAKARDILPLLQGVAKPGNDWYTMGNDDLKEKGAALGYNVRTQEGFNEFLKDIGEQQINYDRAKIAQEAKDEMGWTYWPRKIIAPSAMQEFENAVATGGDYDAATAAKFGALDAGANSAMFYAPSIKMFKNPIVNGSADALLQSAFEAGRQAGKQGLSTTGQEFDSAPVLFSGLAGTTKPVIVGTAQGTVSRIGNPTANEFARGISKAVKTGDPVYTERTALEKAIEKFNKNIAADRARLDQKIKEHGVAGGQLDEIVNLNALESQIGATSVPEKAALLGVSEDPVTHAYDAAKILAAYDKPLQAHRVLDKNGVRFGEEIGDIGGNTIILGDKTSKEFRRLFPAKYTDEASETGASKAGRIAGELLAGYGGRIEPTFKTAGLKMGLNEKTYKDEPWYKNLSVRSRKIIDEAFKKKQEDEEEE